MTILLLFYNYHLPFQMIEKYESLKYLRFQEESIRSVIFWRKVKMKNCFGVTTLEISINLNIRNIYKNQSEILVRSRNLKTQLSYRLFIIILLMFIFCYSLPHDFFLPSYNFLLNINVYYSFIYIHYFIQYPVVNLSY